MNKVIKKWVEALRSGKYQQTQGTLKNLSGYCCLGVLCDLYAQEKGIGWEDHGNLYTFLGEEGHLPYVVFEWADFANSFIMEYPENHFITLNDDKRYDFNQITDEIEEAAK